MTDDTAPPAVTADNVDVGDEGPTVTTEITRQDIVRYAGASGDFNPIHYDEPLAKEKGNPGVFAQGMLSAGFASRAIREWFGLRTLESYQTRFESRVWPGDTLTAAATVSAIEPVENGDNIRVEIDIAVTNGDDERVATGGATVRLPSELE